MMDEEELAAFLRQFKEVLGHGYRDLDLEEDIILPAVEQNVRNIEAWAQPHDPMDRRVYSREGLEKLLRDRHEILGYWKAILEAIRNAPPYPEY